MRISLSLIRRNAQLSFERAVFDRNAVTQESGENFRECALYCTQWTRRALESDSISQIQMPPKKPAAAVSSFVWLYSSACLFVLQVQVHRCVCVRRMHNEESQAAARRWEQLLVGANSANWEHSAANNIHCTKYECTSSDAYCTSTAQYSRCCVAEGINTENAEGE